eukprot:m.95386 g.95386  ORF g.95386 m.95386 type:complete len:214 (+) comp15015_c0_seq2:273-914(+)
MRAVVVLCSLIVVLATIVSCVSCACCCQADNTCPPITALIIHGLIPVLATAAMATFSAGVEADLKGIPGLASKDAEGVVIGVFIILLALGSVVLAWKWLQDIRTRDIPIPPAINGPGHVVPQVYPINMPAVPAVDWNVGCHPQVWTGQPSPVFLQGSPYPQPQQPQQQYINQMQPSAPPLAAGVGEPAVLSLMEAQSNDPPPRYTSLMESTVI